MDMDYSNGGIRHSAFDAPSLTTRLASSDQSESGGSNRNHLAIFKSPRSAKNFAEWSFCHEKSFARDQSAFKTESEWV
jgi:hypothetical protein